MKATDPQMSVPLDGETREKRDGRMEAAKAPPGEGIAEGGQMTERARCGQSVAEAPLTTPLQKTTLQTGWGSKIPTTPISERSQGLEDKQELAKQGSDG